MRRAIVVLGFAGCVGDLDGACPPAAGPPMLVGVSRTVIAPSDVWPVVTGEGRCGAADVQVAPIRVNACQDAYYWWDTVEADAGAGVIRIVSSTDLVEPEADLSCDAETGMQLDYELGNVPSGLWSVEVAIGRPSGVIFEAGSAVVLVP